jgi:acetate kinase
MKILILNSGSSSIKYKVYEVEGDEYTSLANGVAERIGIDGSFVSYSKSGADKVKKTVDLPSHKEAINEVMNFLTDGENGVISSIDDISAVGHRVLHGGVYFSESALIDDDVMAKMEDNVELGPLHMPANIMGIKLMKELSPKMPQVATFDTAFHQTMPPKAYLYGLPKEQLTQHRIRSYGFHGTSHYFIGQKTAEVVGKPVESLKTVSCHIGNGASLCAIDGGKCVDTSMGLTPLAGLLMGTRSGDMDPFTPLHIQKTQGLSVDEVNNMMNKKGGMLGLTGYSDMRDVEDNYLKGEKECVEAFDMYCYRIKKYIGSYIAAMGGVDVITFTAGVGENSPILRKNVLEGLECFGVKLDEKANDVRGTTVISTADSKVKVLVVPTDEEFVIASDTVKLISK